MTQKELKQYEDLDDKFQTRCEVIRQMLIPIHESYNYLNTFELDGDKIWGSGEKYYGDGECEGHVHSFPKEFIYSSDEKIQKYVDEKLEEQRKLNEERAHKAREKQEANDRALYEKLKEKFEKNL